MTATGFRATIDSFFAIGLFTAVLLISLGLGKLTIERIVPGLLSDGEVLIYSSLLGLGLIAYQILLLGLIGVLKPISIGFLLAGNAIAVRNGILDSLNLMLAKIR